MSPSTSRVHILRQFHTIQGFHYPHTFAEGMCGIIGWWNLAQEGWHPERGCSECMGAVGGHVARGQKFFRWKPF